MFGTSVGMQGEKFGSLRVMHQVLSARFDSDLQPNRPDFHDKRPAGKAALPFNFRSPRQSILLYAMNTIMESHLSKKTFNCWNNFIAISRVASRVNWHANCSVDSQKSNVGLVQRPTTAVVG